MKKIHIDKGLQNEEWRKHFPPYLFTLTKKEANQKKVVKIAESKFHQGMVKIMPFYKPISKFFFLE